MEWELQEDGSYIRFGPTGEPEEVIPAPTVTHPKPSPVRVGKSATSSLLIVGGVAAVALLLVMRKR